MSRAATGRPPVVLYSPSTESHVHVQFQPEEQAIKSQNVLTSNLLNHFVIAVSFIVSEQEKENVN